MNIYGLPRKQGLYDPRFERGSCGIGMVAHIHGRKSHQIIRDALSVLERLDHRGARGSDPQTGDGAGILFQIPHTFFSKVLQQEGIQLPASGDYGVGMIFLPSNSDCRNKVRELFGEEIRKEKLRLLGWRHVPVNSDAIGKQARTTEPFVDQMFIARDDLDPLTFERKLFFARRSAEKAVAASQISGKGQFYISSLSSKTIVYKGLLLPHQVGEYYPDLRDPDLSSALGIVHSRFSTNTFPTWSLAHPYRMLCHNGEINTIQGNINWMRSREGSLQSEVYGEDLSKAFPVLLENQSDSACLDNALEFLVLGGRSLAHAMMMLIPEPWVGNTQMDPARAGFYEYHSTQMEPWDGPAAVCFTDGSMIGATLDRNGLRPCRYQIDTDDVVVLASESGVLPRDPSKIREKGRLQPGRMFLIDTVKGRVLDDDEIKAEVSNRLPYRSWVDQKRTLLATIQGGVSVQPERKLSLLELTQLQKVFGFTREELFQVIAPMANEGEEPSSSMGNDVPLAIFSDRSPLLFKYFRQMFAQVTNPPIDPIREQLVMSLLTHLGPRHHLFSESQDSFNHLTLQSPILQTTEMEKIRTNADPRFKSRTLHAIFTAEQGPPGMRRRLTRLCQEASNAITDGCKILILSDQGINSEYAPIPSLLAVSAVHHHLIRKAIRSEVSLIVETGEPRDTHHFACLLGYGGEAIHPYLAFDSLVGLQEEGFLSSKPYISNELAADHYVRAINKGLLKIFSKMGISTLQSYCGAQIFEAIGLSARFVRRYFSGTPSRIEGVGLKEIAEETLVRHSATFSSLQEVPSINGPFGLPEGGEIHYRVQGESHSWNPTAISKLQHATRLNQPETFLEFSTQVNEENRTTTLRGRLELQFAEKAIPIQEVESADEIVKHFTTGAMSFGALGKEAHETLAIAMNRIGAKSNSGEGGEDSERFIPRSKTEWANSAIKQIASARFGVTTHYLVNARELQIKMAQGAKPGEGGQLPGHKVDATIARLRYSTPGVQLISPPPHHDIYSIEDLAQLIFDLKNVNPAALVSVKLVAESGVGTVAAGVCKAGAAKVLISGDSGGTGASPLSSIKYAGIPWEIGLAETHQTLVLNGLRDRICIETDGQLKTGRDVVIAALLGAQEFGFSTAPLIVQGCIMMRKCHLNTCPVGIATQDPELRKRFTGQPEHLINYFFFVAEEIRVLLSQLGVRSLSELTGRTDLLQTSTKLQAKRRKHDQLDLSLLLTRLSPGDENAPNFHPSLPTVLDDRLIELCEPTLERAKISEIPPPLCLEFPIQNTDRATGTKLSGHLMRVFGSDGPRKAPGKIQENLISIRFTGSAGQSFGAFLCSGITLSLEGDANDYVGKGLSGGRISVIPPRGSTFDADKSILIGNTSLYGATSGEAYFKGIAGERFAVRNSGASAVVEGIGDHGCEYMTGGTVVVLGKTGRNFAAGMSGGIAYVFDDDQSFSSRCNLAMVELEPVLATDNGESILQELLEAHLKHTESRKAQEILQNWSTLGRKFIKVIPTEYKKALQQGATHV